MAIFKYLFGYLIIRISGDYCEQLLNIAAKNRIRLWSLCCKKNSIIGCIGIKDFKKLRILKRGINIRVKIIGKRGLPFYIARYNRRIGFFAGVVVFFAALKFLSCFIWTINTVGNETIKRAEIIAACKEIGIYEGVLSSKIDTSNDAKRLTLGSNKIAWASLNIEGSVLTVNITEIKDNVKDAQATNIKASFDGKITKIDVTSGNVMVKVGDTVSKGDLLVSGVIESLGGTAYVRSSGSVYATTTHTYISTGKYENTLKVRTGKKKVHTVLNFFGVKLPLYIGGVRDDYELSTEIIRLKLLGEPMPIFLAKNEFYITKDKRLKYSEGELEDLLKNEIKNQINADNISDFEITESEITENSDGMSIKITVQTLENIALQENLLINTTN